MCLGKSGTELQVEAVRLCVPTAGFVPSLLRSKICLLITESTTTSLSGFWSEDVPHYSTCSVQSLVEITYLFQQKVSQQENSQCLLFS